MNTRSKLETEAEAFETIISEWYLGGAEQERLMDAEEAFEALVDDPHALYGERADMLATGLRDIKVGVIAAKYELLRDQWRTVLADLHPDFNADAPLPDITETLSSTQRSAILFNDDYLRCERYFVSLTGYTIEDPWTHEQTRRDWADTYVTLLGDFAFQTHRIAA